MFSALFFLQFHMVKNRLVARVKRLKQPKYLFGAIAGGLYFYFYFFRWMFHAYGRGQGPASAAPMQPLLYQSLGALIFLAFALSAWIFPRKRAALTFTEAEVAFLFPAPITRRGLINFKLARSQVGIVFSALLFALISGRFSSHGGFLTHAAGWW
ncbi:MAG TPA: putative ABC exporter domain-containing protein, partial [Verrucomicrobiae bacterium]|nr:putative ABC exporter domain-containing protein [Verrucomicrobiae bacterium]